MYSFIVILQAIFHYLGIAGIGLGIIAFLFGNSARGRDLLIGGVSFIVLKYILGFIFVSYLSLRKKGKK